MMLHLVHLYNNAKIRKWLKEKKMSIIIFRLDKCNFLLSSCSKGSLKSFQLIPNVRELENTFLYT